VIFVDPFGRRGVKSCADPGVTAWDAAKDLVSAVAWLKSQPFVDRARITAVGWSWGGDAALTALADYTEEQLVFSRTIAYYPYCTRVAPWKARLPVLLLVGGDDDIARTALCQEAAKQSAAPRMVKIVVYPGAQHAFDMSELPPAKMKGALGTLGYHPQAAAAAWEEVQRFLQAAR
jgi:dienelactone hydrolase